jgi:hypothetical protein
LANTPEPQDLVMIEPMLKVPMARAHQKPGERIYYWMHMGEKVKMNEVILMKRVNELPKLVCEPEMVLTRLYNTHSIVINTKSGEVFDGSAAVM